MDRRLFSLMPESRFARLSASPHDKSRRRTSGGFHPLPFRLTSGRPTILPRPAGRKTKCRAGADPTQHNKRQHRLGTHNAPQGCFSSALFSPLSREFPSSHRPSAGRGKGLASSPAACGRPSRYRQPAKVIRIFHENGKRKVGLFPLKGKKPSCIRGEKTV